DLIQSIMTEAEEIILNLVKKVKVMKKENLIVE
ncbi:hypothetical protein LCGC14_1928070, partial [marine sediment metagenome]